MYLIVLCCLYFLVYGNGKVLTGREGSRRAMRSKAFEQPSSASQASKTSTLTAKIADIQRSASASSSSSQSPDMWVDVDEDNFDPDPPLPVYFEPLSKPLPKQEALSAQSTSPPPATAQVHPDVELQEATPTRTPTRNPTFAPSLQPSGMTKPPPCLTDPSEIAYINDQISATQTLYYCLGNVGDSMLLPSIYNGTLNAIMMVYNNIQLNNLHSIDAVAGTATMDFYWRLYWQDNRLAMPEFWKRMSKTIQKNGIELTMLLTNDSVGMWVPDIRFHDVAQIDYIVETMRINASNIIFWSRHVVGTYMQPKFDFEKYPMDTQTIHLRYGSYAYSQTFLKMVYLDKPISFNQNFDGSATFTENPIWTYDNSTTYSDTYVSGSGFLNAIHHIYVTRRGNGIVIRLILPITMLIMLAGLTFWSDYEGRVDSTVTLLLSVSALYIVILANIPLLGYLTAIDKYVFWMFLLLVLSVVLHQAYATLSDKIDVWPLRIFYLRFLEFIGRVSIFPIAGGFFLQGINELSEILIYGMVFIILPITGTIVVREFFGIKKARETALLRLLDKINSPDCRVDQLSIIEIVVFNYWAFGAFSRSALGISNYLVKHGPFPNPNEQKLTLANFALVDDLIHGRPTATGVELSDMSSRVSHRLGPGSATTNPMTAEVHRRHETPFEARPRSDSHTSAISNTSSAPQFRVVKAKQVEQQFQDQQQENFRQSIMSLNDSDDE